MYNCTYVYIYIYINVYNQLQNITIRSVSKVIIVTCASYIAIGTYRSYCVLLQLLYEEKKYIQ